MPLNCSMSRKFFTHLSRREVETGSSQPLVSITTSLSSIFNFALMGSNLPRVSYKLALFDTIILRVSFSGTYAFILAKSPPI